MATSIKLFQFNQKYGRIIGMESSQLNSAGSTISVKNVLFFVSEAQFIVALSAFMVFEAKSMLDFGTTFFATSSTVLGVFLCLIYVLQMKNYSAFIGNCERFIGKSEYIHSILVQYLLCWLLCDKSLWCCAHLRGAREDRIRWVEWQNRAFLQIVLFRPIHDTPFDDSLDFIVHHRQLLHFWLGRGIILYGVFRCVSTHTQSVSYPLKFWRNCRFLNNFQYFQVCHLIGRHRLDISWLGFYSLLGVAVFSPLKCHFSAFSSDRVGCSSLWLMILPAIWSHSTTVWLWIKIVWTRCYDFATSFRSIRMQNSKLTMIQSPQPARN